jgi:hypothetical protein
MYEEQGIMQEADWKLGDSDNEFDTGDDITA